MRSVGLGFKLLINHFDDCDNFDEFLLKLWYQGVKSVPHFCMKIFILSRQSTTSSNLYFSNQHVPQQSHQLATESKVVSSRHKYSSHNLCHRVPVFFCSQAVQSIAVQSHNRQTRFSNASECTTASNWFAIAIMA